LVLDYQGVLTREEHRKVNRLSVPELDADFNSLVRVAEAVQIRFLWRPLLSDPTDDMVLETAVFVSEDIKKARKILKRTGKEPPREGDEIL